MAGLETRVRPWAGRSNGGPEDFAWSGAEPVKIEDRPLGRLILTNGPRAGEAFAVGERPRRIGAADYCDIVLEDEGRVAPEEARVWVSGGRLMYHKIRRLSSMASDASEGGWLILDPGDELTIGGYNLVFDPSPPDEALPEAAPKQQRARRASRDAGR